MKPGLLTKPPECPSDLPEAAKPIWPVVVEYMVERQQLHSADLPTVRNYCTAIVQLHELEGGINPRYTAVLAWRREVNTLATALMLTPGARARGDKSIRKGSVHGDTAAPHTQWGQKLASVK